MRYLIVACCVLISAQCVWPEAPAFQVNDDGVLIEGVDGKNPVIYDNDWWMDVFDSYYAWALNSRGEIDLRGNVVSRDMWDHPNYTYTLKQSQDEAEKAIRLARESGLKKVPDPTPGAGEALIRPESGKIEDTQAVSSEGSRLIVREARAASKKRPLLIMAGGPLTTVANALLEAPDIADRIIVFSLSTHNFGYNGKDSWSPYIVAKKTRMVEWGAGEFWDKDSVFRAEHFDGLPKNPLTNELKRFIRTDLGRANQLGDGAALVWMMNHACWRGAEERGAVYNGKAVEYRAEAGRDVLNIPKNKTDLKASREEYMRVMSDPATYR
ncbi:MAG: hypothetical protein GC154_21465 [bacterium]|nr:hypothetical protein [bacterium]